MAAGALAKVRRRSRSRRGRRSARPKMCGTRAARSPARQALEPGRLRRGAIRNACGDAILAVAARCEANPTDRHRGMHPSRKRRRCGISNVRSSGRSHRAPVRRRSVGLRSMVRRSDLARDRGGRATRRPHRAGWMCARAPPATPGPGGSPRPRRSRSRSGCPRDRGCTRRESRPAPRRAAKAARSASRRRRRGGAAPRPSACA